jgi:hypothetical protein
VSPRPACTPRGSRSARPHSHIMSLRVHYPTHKQPSPPDTTSSPSAIPEGLLSWPSSTRWDPQGVKGSGEGSRNKVCVGSLQTVFKLFYLESYLGSSEETPVPKCRL